MVTTTTTKLPDIRKTIVINAPLEKVWKAISTSDGLASWWMPNTFKPEMGYEFVLKTAQFGDSKCKVTELIPHKKISFDWDKDWHLTFEIKKISENSCEFTLVHSGWDASLTTIFSQPHTAIRKVMDDGWTNMVNTKLVKSIIG